jgi:SAM-dependent methyltransferase
MKSRLVLRAEDGELLPLHPSRWHGPPTAEEQQLLASLDGPVLDVGCGPGRLLDGLNRRGVVALGVDPAPGAVALARRRGCAVLQRSVFERLPGERRWRSVLLLDGNVGIGGDPVRLLRRCRSLMRPDGVVIAEVERPGTGLKRCQARLERDVSVGEWFGWSIVGVEAIPDLAAEAGLVTQSVQHSPDDRWFVQLGTERGTERGPEQVQARACA